MPQKYSDNDFKIIKANLSTAKFLGVPSDEMIGKRCHELVHGTKQSPEDCPLLKAKKTKGHEEIEVYIAEKDIWAAVLTFAV